MKTPGATNYKGYILTMIVSFARANHRDAARMNREGSKISAAHCKGRAQAYMVAARMMSEAASAKTRNFNFRKKAA